MPGALQQPLRQPSQSHTGRFRPSGGHLQWLLSVTIQHGGISRIAEGKWGCCLRTRGGQQVNKRTLPPTVRGVSGRSWKDRLASAAVGRKPGRAGTSGKNETQEDGPGLAAWWLMSGRHQTHVLCPCHSQPASTACVQAAALMFPRIQPIKRETACP